MRKRRQSPIPSSAGRRCRLENYRDSPSRKLRRRWRIRASGLRLPHRPGLKLAHVVGGKATPFGGGDDQRLRHREGVRRLPAPDQCLRLPQSFRSLSDNEAARRATRQNTNRHHAASPPNRRTGGQRRFSTNRLCGWFGRLDISSSQNYFQRSWSQTP